MDLVTGGSGLIGMHFIAALLRENRKVRALRRKSADLRPIDTFLKHLKLDPAAVEWVEGSLLDVSSIEEAMKGVDRVFHAAAVVSFHKNDRDLLYQTNIEGTANMVNCALAEGVNSFVYISSVAALGRQDEGRLVSESTEWKDDPELSHYARSKHMAEREVWRGREEGLNVVVLNPGIVIGIGDFTRSSAEIFAQVDKGLPYYPPGSNGYVAVQDIIEAAFHLLEEDRLNERFLLVGEHLSYRELFEKIGIAIGRNAPKKMARPWMMKTVRLVFALHEFFTQKRSFVTKENVRNATRNYRYDNSRMRATGFDFTPLDQVINETGRYYRSEFSPS